MGFIIAIVVALALVPVIDSACDDAIQGDIKYHTDETINSSFTDNTAASPDNWDNSVTDNRVAYLDTTNKWIYSSGDNGTCEWYQSLTISSIYDGVTSATIAAKFRLGDNENLSTITTRVILDNSTDNITIWESTSTENSASWTSIENNVASYITAAGTCYIRLFDNVSVTETATVCVYWDDAVLTVVTGEYDPLTGAPKVMLQLVPLFYIIGVLSTAIVWISKGSKR